MVSFFSKGFDPSKVAPDNGFEPLPEGAYACIIRKADEKATKPDENGKAGLQLVLEMHVVEGPHKSRVVFHRITLENKNAKAVTIGEGQLSALCRAVGITKAPAGAFEFCNKVLRVHLTHVDNGSYGIQNKVKKVEPMGGAMAAPVAAPTPVMAGAPSGAAPWAAV